MRALVSRLRPLFFYAGLFSLAINLLLLVPPLYMLQVFDRVLASRSGETLAVLTIAAVVALFVMAILDVLRAWLLAAGGAMLDRNLGPRVLDGVLVQTAKVSGAGYLNGVRRATEEKGVGRIATVVGRYYAMDRDRRWDRTQVAYEALVEGRACASTGDPEEALQESYAREITDEFVKPIVVEGTPRVGDGDAVIFFNFRADRARQLTRTFTDSGFDGFERELLSELHYATMTQYDRTFDLPYAFLPRVLTEVAGEVWERAGCSNLRIAETEKYAHVTYFFNGGREEPYDREERILVPSPKVATYDLQPEMSAPEVTDRLVEAIRSGRFDSFVLNYANPDMVGHTGVLQAAIRAVEAVDAGLGKVVEAFRETEPDGSLIVLADHGNAETMVEEDGSPHTAHTTNLVPCILVSSAERALREGGALCDAVPTLLALQGIDRPAVMSGRDLRG